jgi:hypothetical protein
MHILTYLRRHSLLFIGVAIGLLIGGGAAIAATTTSSTTIHACVSRKNGAVYIAKRCTKTTRTLNFNQRGPTGATGPAGAAGAAAPSISGDVGDNSAIGSQQGLTITQTGTGTYNVTITACPGRGTDLVGSPNGAPVGSSTTGPPSVVVTGSGSSYQVTAGNISGGTVVPTDQGFDLVGECA